MKYLTARLPKDPVGTLSIVSDELDPKVGATNMVLVPTIGSLPPDRGVPAVSEYGWIDGRYFIVHAYCTSKEAAEAALRLLKSNL